MSWLDLAVQVVPDSLIQRAKALQETLRFEQVEKERQARLEEEIRRKLRGETNDKGEKSFQSGLAGEDTILGRRGPSRSILRRPIGMNLAASDGARLAVCYLKDEGSDVLTVYSADGMSSASANVSTGLGDPASTQSGYEFVAGTLTLTTYNRRSYYAIYSDSLTIGLPVNGDTMMIVVATKKATGRRQWEAVSVQEYIVEDGLQVENGGTVEITNPGDDPAFNQSYKVTCFVVSATSARIVMAPSAFVDAVHNLMEPYPGVTGSFIFDEVEDVAAEVRDAFGITGQLFWDPTPVPAYDATAMNNSTPWSNLNGNWSLYRYYGIGFFTTDRHETFDAYTPSMFTLLSGGIPAVPLGDQINYSDVTGAYPVSLPPRNYVGLCALDGQCPLGFGSSPVESAYTTTAPTSVNVAMSQDLFIDNSSDNALQVLNEIYKDASGSGVTGAERYIAYDGGQPEYCIDKLLSYGFSLADLTP
jgi:hypothetical protein